MAAAAVLLSGMLDGVTATADSGGTSQGTDVLPSGAIDGLLAPPRNIADITAILDEQKPDPAAVSANLTIANAAPDPSLHGLALARFYMRRGAAAGELGRDGQRLADYGRACDLVRSLRDEAPNDYGTDLGLLAMAEGTSGNHEAALRLIGEKVAYFEAATGAHQGQLFREYTNLVFDYSDLGQFPKAQAVLDKADALLTASKGWSGMKPYFAPLWQSEVDWAQGYYLRAQGKYADAETVLREALAVHEIALAQARQSAPSAVVEAIESGQDLLQLSIARDLVRQNRLLEAESVARVALLATLQLRGHYASETARDLAVLAAILMEEGRQRDAETLARAAIDIYLRLGHGPQSYVLNVARADLGYTLLVGRRYAEAMAQFDAIRASLTKDTSTTAALIDDNLAYALVALRLGRTAEGLRVAKRVYDERVAMLGNDNYDTAEAEGFYAVALAANGDKAGAEAAFRAAVPILIAGSRGAANDSDSQQGRQRRLKFVLERYIALLWNDRASIGPDKAAAEAFEVADAIRGQAVQQALIDASERAAVRDPGLAALVRQDQDAERRVTALNSALAQALALPSDQQDAMAIADARAELVQLHDMRTAIRTQLEARFPGYSSLIDPLPMTDTAAEALLGKDQALFVSYVAEDQSYAWALSPGRPLAFAAVPATADEIAGQVALLRKSLDPEASTLAEIPPFDVETAARLYDEVLRPVEAGWKGTANLLIVAHGSLAEIPFGVLVTAHVSEPQDPAGAPLFSAYRQVPWLIREASITDLPSVASLRALSMLAAAPSAPRPFVGFGDAWFNGAEAAEAEASEPTGPSTPIIVAGAVSTRGVPVKLRGVPPSSGAATVDLSSLPRLPETADELKQAALALAADPAGDVYLGKRASEKEVRAMKLDDRRVVMFATHGLVPGDLRGLDEPALALTAPGLIGDTGDGLLTTSKILSLRLNADWVVLSACNTAAGNGAGAEAVTGLGLAFLYAGARSILVSNWPVETHSASALTVGAFRDLARMPGETRAAALRQSMLELIDSPGYRDASGQEIFSYAHPIFWAPFSLVGDGGTSH